MTPPTFQIGDEVLITGPAEYGSKLHMGKKFKIETYHKASPAFGGRDLYSGRGFPWYPASSLRLAPQFTIGNLVEVVRASNYDSRHLVGEKFTIDDIEGDRCTAVGYPWIRADCLRLVEELKIGDWVEVIGKPMPLYAECLEHEIGRIFEITQEDTKNHEWFSCQCNPTYPATSLRKLTPEEVAEHLAPIPYVPTIDDHTRRLDFQRDRIDDIDERLSVIEKRLDFVENIQREQTRDALYKGWRAGP